MVMIENIHHGEYLEQSKVIRQLNVSAIDTIASVYKRGVADGMLPQGARPDRAPLAGQRALLLQRLQPRDLLEDFRPRFRGAESAVVAAEQRGGDGDALRGKGRSVIHGQTADLKQNDRSGG